MLDNEKDKQKIIDAISEKCHKCGNAPGTGFFPCNSCEEEGYRSCCYDANCVTCSGKGEVECKDCDGYGFIPCDVCAQGIEELNPKEEGNEVIRSQKMQPMVDLVKKMQQSMKKE